MKKFWYGKKVLVTGGAGFIGSYVVEELVSYGAQVTVCISPKTSLQKVHTNLKKVKDLIAVKRVDLLSKEKTFAVAITQDIILHFAALDGGKTFKTQNAELLFNVNLNMGRNVLEAAKENNVQRLLIISSIEVYPSETNNPIDEDQADIDNKKLLNEGYAGAKREIEREAIEYHNKYKLPIAIARLGNTYGPRDHTDDKKKRVIPTFISQAIYNEEITLWGDGSTEFSFIHAADLAPNILKLVEKYAVADPVNLVSSQYISLKDLAEQIINLTKSKSNIKYIRSAAFIKNNRVFSLDKAIKELRFKEKILLPKGLKQIIKSL